LQRAEQRVAERISAQRSELAELVDTTEQDLATRRRKLDDAIARHEVDARQLQQESEAIARERDQVRQLHQEIAAYREEINRKEMAVISGWEEVRRAQAEIEVTQDRLAQQAAAQLEGRQPAGEPIRIERPRRLPSRPAPRAQPAHPALRHWPIWLSAAAGIIFAIVLTGIYFTVPPEHHAEGSLQFNTELRDPRAATDLALDEMEGFARHQWPAASIQRDPTGLRVGRVYVELNGDAEATTGSTTAVFRVRTVGPDTDGAVSRVNDFIDKYFRWRDDRLAASGLLGHDKELKREMRRRYHEVELLGQAHDAAREWIADAFNLPRKAWTAPPRLLIEKVDEQLWQDADRLHGVAARLQSIARTRADWMAQVRKLRAEGGPLLTERTAERLAEQVSNDMREVRRLRDEVAALRQRATKRLEKAESRWQSARLALAAVLDLPNSPARTRQLEVVSKSFRDSPLEYKAALDYASKHVNKSISNLLGTIESLRERIAKNREELDDYTKAWKRAERIIELESMLDRNASAEWQLQQDLRRLLSQRIQLWALRNGYVHLTEKLEQSKQRRAEILQQLKSAESVSTAWMEVAPTPAEPAQVIAVNPRERWMWIAGGLVFLIATAVGFAIQVGLWRWRSRGEQRGLTIDDVPTLEEMKADAGATASGD
jgi:hypothetical protein